MKFIRCQGSFESVGRQVGEACKADIQELYERVVAYLLDNTTVGSPSKMRDIAMAYSSETDRTWPSATQYLKGLAAGAEVPFEKLAVIAYSEEIASGFVPVPAKCSTLVVQTTSGALIGHNEDYEPHYFGKMVLLDVTFDGYPRVVGLTYPGMLPNLAGSLNSSGMAITNNSLWMDARPGLSKQVQHFHASLANEFEEAVEHLALQPVSLTTHYTVAHGPRGQVASLEVSNSLTALEQVSLVTIGPEPFCHTNHVLYLNLKEPDPAVVAGNHSLARLAKLQVLPRERLPRTPEQMLDLLSTNDGVLHRTAEQNPNSVTLSTVVIRPHTGEMWVRDSDPNAQQRDWHFSVRSSMLN